MTASTNSIEIPQGEVTQCVICEKPLGQESRDLEYIVCHEHRKCSKCGRDVQPPEVNYCLTHGHAVTHARELVLVRKDADTDTELLNLARLVFWPNPSLSRATLKHTTTTQFNLIVSLLQHEQILLIMDQAQAIAAACSSALSKNRREIEQELGEREASRFAEATATAARNNLTKSDKKAMSAEEKSLKMFMDLGMSESAAREQVKELKAARKDMLK